MNNTPNSGFIKNPPTIELKNIKIEIEEMVLIETAPLTKGLNFLEFESTSLSNTILYELKARIANEYKKIAKIKSSATYFKL
jgi:hypothetical protein